MADGYPVPDTALWLMEMPERGAVVGIKITTPVSDISAVLCDAEQIDALREALLTQLRKAEREYRMIRSGIQLVTELPAGLRKK